MIAANAVPGVFGKIPARADFVRRRLPATFLGPWDAWLGSALARSRSDLGPAWPEGEARVSKMVFIGLDLPRDILVQGLDQALT